MVSDIKKYTSNCLICQKRKPGLKFKSKLGKFPPITTPNHTLGCDLIGPLSTTLKGNKYVLTIVDHFSRYVYLYPIPNKETTTVTQSLIFHCVAHGPPVYIVSDLGSEFISDLWKKVCNNLSIQMHYTTAFRPMTNGLTENRNRYLIDNLYFLKQTSPQEWDDQLIYTAAAMNSAFCKPINDTPFFINHGRDYNFDFSKALNNTTIPYTADTDHNVEMSMRLTKAFKSVMESDSYHKDQYSTQYNKNLKLHSLTPGSLVLLRNETKVNTLGRKFAPRFTGPYRILDFVTTNKCHIKPVHFQSDKTYLVHTDRLKPCNLIEDTYPKFDNLPTDSDNELEIGPNSKITPSPITPITPLDKINVKHNYNLRTRK
jgi:transposase InsO family protein